MTHDAQHPQPIELKCWSISFQAIKDGTKRFEYRKDDRPYGVGVTVLQREWNPDTGYTGDSLYHDITFIIRGGVFGIPGGYCIFSTSEPRTCTSRSSTPAPASDPEDWRKEVAKFTEEDPLFMAYVKGQEAGRAEATAAENKRILKKIEKGIKELEWTYGACDFWSKGTVKEIRDLIKSLRSHP